MLKINNTTIIAIAHHLSTIKYMDRIIIMDGGKIIEDGNFQELLAKENSKFKTLWDHQIDGMML